MAVTSVSPAGYRELLRTGRWFAALPEPLQDLLLARATLRTFPKRSVLIQAWRPASGLFGVVDGRVLLRTRLNRTRPTVFMALDTPSWFGEWSMIDPAAAPLGIDVVADVETTTIWIAAEDVRALLAAHPAYWQHLATLAAYHMRVVLTGTIDREHAAPEARVARRLVWMASGHGDSVRKSRRIAVSQASLAMMVDQSRQTLNTHLKTLERRNLVRIGYCSIEVLDAEGLSGLG